jgi:hypothetical protein
MHNNLARQVRAHVEALHAVGATTCASSRRLRRCRSARHLLAVQPNRPIWDGARPRVSVECLCLTPVFGLGSRAGPRSHSVKTSSLKKDEFPQSACRVLFVDR